MIFHHLEQAWKKAIIGVFLYKPSSYGDVIWGRDNSAWIKLQLIDPKMVLSDVRLIYPVHEDRPILIND